LKKIKIKEWGETICSSEADGPLSCCDEFQTPISYTSQWHPS